MLHDVLNGYSKAKLGGNGDLVYVKHLNAFDSGSIDECHEEFYSYAKARGLPTEAEQDAFIRKDGLWTPDDDKQLNDNKSFLAGLRTTRSKLALPSKKRELDVTINETEAKISELNTKRTELIGQTVEHFAIKKVNEEYLYYALFSDAALTKKYLTEEEFREIDQEDLLKLFRLYESVVNNFLDRNLKLIAILPTFLNMISLANDNVFFFYGRPIVDLSFYQINAFHYGLVFKSIFQESKDKIPPEYLDEPEKILSWYETFSNSEKMMNQEGKANDAEIQSRGIVGGTAADLKELGIKGDKSPIDMRAEALKKGGSLSIEDVIRLQGGEL